MHNTAENQEVAMAIGSLSLYTFCSRLCFGKRRNMIVCNNDFVQYGEKFPKIYFTPEENFIPMTMMRD